MPENQPLLRLADLRQGQRARVVALDEAGLPPTLAVGELERRLIEMGVLEGAEVEVTQEGAFGRDPIAVRVDEHLLALRRSEAEAIRVALLG